ncbi:MAG: hypothetical protein IRZ27_04880 [Acidothermus cellulolyticus]|nr:hypothetical protein [Acidothermus cellulolyticus]
MPRSAGGRSSRDTRWPAPVVVCCAVGLVGVLLAGCSAHRPTPPPSTGAQTSTAGPLLALRAAAARAQHASYTATYRALGTSPPRSGTVAVYRTPDAVRLDVTETGAAALRILVTAQGTFSCTLPGPPTPPPTGTSAPACVTLAGPTSTVPPSLDPGLQHVFTSTLEALAGSDDVRVAGTPEPRTIAGYSATCFAVTFAAASIARTPGTYCFTADGILAAAIFRSSSITLVTVDGAPVPGDFQLPASPVPLTPQPTPAGSGG